MWGVYTGVDFGCFSTKYGDCEALEEREEQTDFTLFLCIPSPEGVRGEITKNGIHKNVCHFLFTVAAYRDSCRLLLREDVLIGVEDKKTSSPDGKDVFLIRIRTDRFSTHR